MIRNYSIEKMAREAVMRVCIQMGQEGVGTTFLIAKFQLQGVRWLSGCSGRVIDAGSRGCGFKPYQRHCIVLNPGRTHSKKSGKTRQPSQMYSNFQPNSKNMLFQKPFLFPDNIHILQSEPVTII